MSPQRPALLIDVNILVYGADATSSFHDAAVTFLEDALSGPTPIGMPWEVLTGFMRVVTNPRITNRPLTSDDAWSHVESWSGAEPVWHPGATDRHAEILERLVRGRRLSGNVIPDAHLAAIAVGHGLTIASTDSDFALFDDVVSWFDPLRG